MKEYTKQEILNLILETALNVGISTNLDVYKNGLAVLKAESGLDSYAFNVNANGSVDIGLCQWNSYWAKYGE